MLQVEACRPAPDTSRLSALSAMYLAIFQVSPCSSLLPVKDRRLTRKRHEMQISIIIRQKCKVQASRLLS